MLRHLPPLNAVRVFEAAARHLSFSQAAEELSVTQSAVSKQISLLESRLEISLFERRNGRISLTKQGEEYLPAVSAALNSLAEATLSISTNREHQQNLAIDVIPSFASLWLIPRLHSFQVVQPDIQVELNAGDGAINPVNSSADLAIRCLQHTHAPASARLLTEETLLLVASQEYLADHPVDGIEDILQQRVIPQTTRPHLWDQFLGTLGFSYHNLKYAIKSEHFFISLQSVKASLGLGLLPEFLIRDRIANGQLQHVLQLGYKSEYGYFITSPGYKMNLHKVQCFVGWLEAQICRADETKTDR